VAKPLPEPTPVLADDILNGGIGGTMSTIARASCSSLERNALVACSVPDHQSVSAAGRILGTTTYRATLRHIVPMKIAAQGRGGAMQGQRAAIAAAEALETAQRAVARSASGQAFRNSAHSIGGS